MSISLLQQERHRYLPKVPDLLRGDFRRVCARRGLSTTAVADYDALRSLFARTYGQPLVNFVNASEKNEDSPMETAPEPRGLRVAIVLSGGQAPGGHNVIAGLFDGLKRWHADSVLIGFLGGPAGVLSGDHIEICADRVDAYRNTGGFDLIGSGRTKIESDSQFAAAAQTVTRMALDALVVVGGDDSNTNAALLAEHFVNSGISTKVIGVPKTIDGDLKNEAIETSFGFDTATKTYSELIGNIARDACSARKYWHFIKLMGRSASHIALECALKTQPNVCLISEEVAAQSLTLAQIVQSLCDTIATRAQHGEHFGIVLVPEGLIEFIPEMKALITELNEVMARRAQEFEALDTPDAQRVWIEQALSASARAVFNALPAEISTQLLADRDPHGNVQVSRIDTERLLILQVTERLAQMKQEGTYTGVFSSIAHFFGYEGRCAFPSNFDADYCYTLGLTACLLAVHRFTGYVASVRNLTSSVAEWAVGGVPLTMLMNMERRHGSQKPVIKKALVDLEGMPFRVFSRRRASWALKTSYVYPGAVQYYGPPAVCDEPSVTIRLERPAPAANSSFGHRSS